MRIVLAVLSAQAAVLVGSGSAAASSGDAWAEFRAAVLAACSALVTEPGRVEVVVNPFGSESYGAALVIVASDAGTTRQICIYDKQAKTAELTGPFAD